MKAYIICSDCGMKLGEWEKQDFTLNDYAQVPEQFASDCGKPGQLILENAYVADPSIVCNN